MFGLFNVLDEESENCAVSEYYVIAGGDCPDVTIDFNATFERCTTDYCTGDSYHVDYE